MLYFYDTHHVLIHFFMYFHPAWIAIWNILKKLEVIWNGVAVCVRYKCETQERSSNTNTNWRNHWAVKIWRLSQVSSQSMMLNLWEKSLKRAVRVQLDNCCMRRLCMEWPDLLSRRQGQRHYRRWQDSACLDQQQQRCHETRKSFPILGFHRTAQ